jgi:hypothetical protein
LPSSQSPFPLLLIAHPAEDEKLLSALRPHMMESDIQALADVLNDVRTRMNRKF